jgi:hypothetical protein
MSNFLNLSSITQTLYPPSNLIEPGGLATTNPIYSYGNVVQQPYLANSIPSPLNYVQTQPVIQQPYPYQYGTVVQQPYLANSIPFPLNYVQTQPVVQQPCPYQYGNVVQQPNPFPVNYLQTQGLQQPYLANGYYQTYPTAPQQLALQEIPQTYVQTVYPQASTTTVELNEALCEGLSTLMRKSPIAFSSDFYVILAQVNSLLESPDCVAATETLGELKKLQSLVDNLADFDFDKQVYQDAVQSLINHFAV